MLATAHPLVNPMADQKEAMQSVEALQLLNGHISMGVSYAEAIAFVISALELDPNEASQLAFEYDNQAHIYNVIPFIPRHV